MKHERLSTCGSTNDEVRRAFEQGAPLPVLISAEEQTAGRGREGRTWLQLPGNFAGSFLVEATRALRQEPGLVSIMSGLAVRDALIEMGAQPAELTVKWPNDVLLDENKVAGILAEMVEDHQRRAFIIGIGVNLNQSPAETMFPAASVFGTGAPDPKEFGDTLGQRLLNWIKRVEESGPGLVLDAFRRVAWRFGQPIAVRQGEGTIEGIFSDVDAHGHMVLSLPQGGQRVINAGDATRT